MMKVDFMNMFVVFVVDCEVVGEGVNVVVVVDVNVIKVDFGGGLGVGVEKLIMIDVVFMEWCVWWLE